MAVEDSVTWVVCSRRVSVSIESRGWAGGGCSSAPPELLLKGRTSLSPGTRFHPTGGERVSEHKMQV